MWQRRLMTCPQLNATIEDRCVGDAKVARAPSAPLGLSPLDTALAPLDSALVLPALLPLLAPLLHALPGRLHRVLVLVLILGLLRVLLLSRVTVIPPRVVIQFTDPMLGEHL